MKNIEIDELRDAIEKRIESWKRTQAHVMENGLRISSELNDEVAKQANMNRRAERILSAAHALMWQAELMDKENCAITELEAVLSLIESGGGRMACAAFADGSNKVS